MSPMIDISRAAKTFTMHLQKRRAAAGGVRHHDAGECRRMRRAGRPLGCWKSSILKMIFGNYRCDEGRIAVRHDGDVIDIATAQPRDILRVRRQTIGLCQPVPARGAAGCDT